MSPKQLIQSGHGEVALVLVVDGVKLAMIHEVLDIRHLDHCHASLLQKNAYAFDEPVEVRDVRQNIVGDDHVGSPSFRPQLPREILIEEGTESRNAFLPGNLSRPFGRIDPEHGNTTPREV